MASKRSNSHLERTAVLETEIQGIKEQLDANSLVLADIRNQMARQKGFLGGIVFVVSAVWGLIALAVNYLPVKP